MVTSTLFAWLHIYIVGDIEEDLLRSNGIKSKCLYVCFQADDGWLLFLSCLLLEALEGHVMR